MMMINSRQLGALYTQAANQVHAAGTARPQIPTALITGLTNTEVNVLNVHITDLQCGMNVSSTDISGYT